MKEIQLARGKGVALVDDDAHLERPWLITKSWYYKPPNKVNKTAYAIFSLYENRKIDLRMHRYILFGWPEPEWAIGREADHQDGNGLNNQRGNLRIATRIQNEIRNGPRKGRYKGVDYDKSRKKWRAKLCVNHKSIWLGYFNDDEEAAARAYDEGVKQYRPDLYWDGWAYLNFPEVRTLALAEKALDIAA